MPFKFPRASSYSYRVGRSSAGLGLFATQDMLRGAFVIEYFGTLLSGEEADRNNGKYMFEIEKDLVIDGAPRNNIARYLNHACRPNCYAEIDGKRVFIYVKRKIWQGEELTYHYGKQYWEEFIKPIGCRCAWCSGKKRTRRF